MKHDVSCPTCDTLHADVPVESDEDGDVFIAIEAAPCSQCGVMLCPCCSKFSCDGCAETFCSEHVVLVPSSDPLNPLKCCALCAAESELTEPARCCPECMGIDLVAAGHGEYVEAETGYRESWDLFRCRSCGHSGEVDDLVPARPIRKPAGREEALPVKALPASA